MTTYITFTNSLRNKTCKRCPADVFLIDKNKLDMNFPEDKSSNFIKNKTLAQVFSCEFYKVLKTPFL